MNRIFAFSIYSSVLISGAAILIIEILGTRILAPLYGTTIYVWSGLITVTLLALALGYILGGKLADTKHNPFWFFTLFIVSGISMLVALQFRAALLLYSDSFGVLYGPLIAAFLFLVPLSFLGMIDPFAVRLRVGEVSLVGTRAGYIFGISTLGGLMGALSGAYILLPQFSLTQIFAGVSYALIFAGIIGISIFKIGINKKGRTEKKKNYNIFFILGLLFLSWILSGIGTALSNGAISESKRFGQAEVLYEKRNIYSLNRVLAIPNRSGVLCFSADGGLQTCIDPNNKDEVGYTAKMGLFIKQLPKNSHMLLLGMGGGKIIKEQGRTDIDTDIVDINPATFYVAQNFMGVKLSERQKTYLMDGRRFLRTNSKMYDLILIDVSTTLTPPTHFYTKEFFELIAKRLNPHGLAIFQFTEEKPQTDLGFQTELATIRNILPYTFADHDGVITLLVMGKQENMPIISEVNRKIREIQSKYNAFNDVHEFLPDKEAVKQGGYKIITDDYNLAEIYWRKKILLFKRFNILIKKDLI